MVKRIYLVILFCISIMMLCSCDWLGKNADKFPQLHIAPTSWRADGIYIPLRENHQFAINYLYDEVETDQGYDIIIHIRRETND